MGYETQVIINEEVLTYLFKKAITIEEANIIMLLRLFVAEEDFETKKVLYETMRDCECHKMLVMECLKTLKGAGYPETMEFKQYVFEDMFHAERSAVLKRAIITLKDYYNHLLEDVKLAEIHNTVDKNVTQHISGCLKILIKEKERHMKLIKEIWKF